MADAQLDIVAIFGEALARKSDEERSRYLDEACRTDPQVRGRVEALLRAHSDAGGFLGGQPPARAAALDQPITEKPGAQIGPYKLLQQIGEGGMGVVYMADQSQPVERRVALKIIKPGMDTRQVIARFQAEQQALAVMDHPNIAKVLDAATTDSGRPYFVMELVKGLPITQYCDEHHLTPRQRLELFVPVCHAVQHAHQKGIIHRDLKPTNVLVAEYDDRPAPKIIDFGVAKAIDQRLTERTMFTAFGQVMGTIDYMSPEQAKLNQLDIDTRSDIYSLGVLLYELLTGETPLDRQRLRSAAFDEMLRIIREEEPPKPSLRLSSSDSLPSIAANRQIEPKKLSTLVRGELDWIVMKALEKERSRRYETANGLAADIERYLSDEPVLACPPSAAYRLRKLVRRNKGPVAAVSLVLVALVAGIIGTTWGLVRAEKARRAAIAAQLAEADRAEGERLAKSEAQKALEAQRKARGEAQEAAEAERKAREAETAQRLRAEEAANAERKAKQAETTQRLRAEDNAKLAMSVLDEIFLSGARQRANLSAQDEAKGLAENPERDKLEREFLEKGLKFYEQLAQSNATDWATRRQRAKAYANVGLLQADLKNPAESEKAYQRAVHLMEELAGERPDDFDNAWDLAYTYHWFGWRYLDSDRLQPAEEKTRHALALFEKLTADFPLHRPQARSMVAQCQGNLGEVLRRAGKPQEAEKALRQTLAIWAELAAVNDAAPDFRFPMACAHEILAGILQSADRPDEAEKELRQAISLWERLRIELPEREEYRRNSASDLLRVAKFDWQRAEILTGAGKPTEAAECYRRALGLIEKAIAICPDDPFFYQEQGWASWLLASLLQSSGRASEAEEVYRQAVAIQEKLAAKYPLKTKSYGQRLSYILGDLVENLRLQGKQKEAEEALRQTLAMHEKLLAEGPPGTLYLARRVDIYAELGQWEKAAADYAKAVELKPNQEATWYYPPAPLGSFRGIGLDLKPDQARTWCVLAPLRFGTADTEGYRSTCTSIFDRFGKTDDPDTAYWVVWPCVLAPDAIAQPAVLVSLAEKAVAGAPANYDYLNTLGAALYRAGRLDEAVRRLSEAAAAYKPDAGFRQPLLYNRFFLAMARQRRGEAEEARQELDKALQAMDQPGEQKGKDAACKVLAPWNRRLTAQLLRREAETLIHGHAELKEQGATKGAKDAKTKAPR